MPPLREEKSDRTWVRDSCSSHCGRGRRPRGSRKASSKAGKGGNKDKEKETAK